SILVRYSLSLCFFLSFSRRCFLGGGILSGLFCLLFFRFPGFLGFRSFYCFSSFCCCLLSGGLRFLAAPAATSRLRLLGCTFLGIEVVEIDQFDKTHFCAVAKAHLAELNDAGIATRTLANL